MQKSKNLYELKAVKKVSTRAYTKEEYKNMTINTLDTFIKYDIVKLETLAEFSTLKTALQELKKYATTFKLENNKIIIVEYSLFKYTYNDNTQDYYINNDFMYKNNDYYKKFYAKKKKL